MTMYKEMKLMMMKNITSIIIIIIIVVMMLLKEGVLNIDPSQNKNAQSFDGAICHNLAIDLVT